MIEENYSLQLFGWMLSSPYVPWFDSCPFLGILVAFGVVIWSKIYKVAKTWHCHFWLANVVVDWFRAVMKAVTRKAGIRFRPTPRPQSQYQCDLLHWLVICGIPPLSTGLLLCRVPWVC
jgi:hypothetical protein